MTAPYRGKCVKIYKRVNRDGSRWHQNRFRQPFGLHLPHRGRQGGGRVNRDGFCQGFFARILGIFS